MRAVKVDAVRFVGAAATAGQYPPEGLPEIAIAGRSNVGKSSLINTVLGRRGLARTSRTPGRTRQLNFFLVNDAFVVVDLPGYGFAAGPAEEREAWGPLVETYLRERSTLAGVLVLIDVRRGVEEDEDQLLAFLRARRLPAAVAATKVDKLGYGAAKTALAGLARRLGDAVPLIGFSARTGAGKDDLSRLLAGWVAACRSRQRRS